jgi:hypothetical protein
MRCLIPLLCVVASACTTYSEAPPNLELTWAKPHVAFETFAADVDTCNVTAEAAGRAVEPRHGDAANDLSPPILAWRWLAHGADVDGAMAEAYETCFGSRGYFLVSVSEADARAFRDIGVAPFNADVPQGQRSSQTREAQLRLLHRLAMTAQGRRVRIETRQQRRPLLSYIAPQ